MSETDARAQLHLEFSRLRDEMRADVAELADLRAVASRREEIERYTRDLEHQLERLPRSAVITLVGATGAGKSALLNALVGQPIAKEGVNRPTTVEPVVYAPHEADLEALLGPVNPPPVVVRYERAVAGPWTTQVLIDAPDTNSVAAEHRATVGALAERSDVLVVVLHRQSVVELASVSFIDDFARRRRLVFVLNRVDEISDEARGELLAQVRTFARERWNAPDAPVVGVSARDAQTQPRAAGWGEFCEVLHHLVRDSAMAGVRRLNALGTAARVEGVFAAVREEVEADLLALPEEAAAGVLRLAQRAGEETATRLRLRSPEVAERLLAEAARRWDGPGGWVLRMGGFGGLGIGAGALLARSHPLLAAGAAVGSLVAGQANDGAQRRRLVEAEGLLPARAEFTSWYVDAVAAARVRAARIAGDPALLGLPHADDLRAAAGCTVEEAWSQFVDRDLPAAADRSALRFLRFPLDLPVYALGGWVVYRVGEGFLSGNYAGTDFLVNALLLLAAYLVAVAVIVRHGLRWSARRLLAQVVGGARAGVAELGESVRAGVAAAAERRVGALRRLAAISATWRQRLRLPD